MKKPRPICPECGSADVVTSDKTGSCNRCGETFSTERALSYIKGTGERRHIERRRLSDEEADDQFARAVANSTRFR